MYDSRVIKGLVVPALVAPALFGCSQQQIREEPPAHDIRTEHTLTDGERSDYLFGQDLADRWNEYKTASDGLKARKEAGELDDNSYRSQLAQLQERLDAGLLERSMQRRTRTRERASEYTREAEQLDEKLGNGELNREQWEEARDRLASKYALSALKRDLDNFYSGQELENVNPDIINSDHDYFNSDEWKLKKQERQAQEERAKERKEREALGEPFSGTSWQYLEPGKTAMHGIDALVRKVTGGQTDPKLRGSWLGHSLRGITDVWVAGEVGDHFDWWDFEPLDGRFFTSPSRPQRPVILGPGEPPLEDGGQVGTPPANNDPGEPPAEDGGGAPPGGGPGGEGGSVGTPGG